LRKSGFLKIALKGKFYFQGLIFNYSSNDLSIAESILTNGSYENQTLKEIKYILKKGSVFIDGGANIGYYSLIASKIVGNQGIVIAFEPTPLVFNYLKKNIKENKSNNILLSDKGLFSSKKELSFLLKSKSEAN
jgi:hypothetical protein